MIERLRGCFRNFFALVGCATVLVAGGILAWQYRAALADGYRWAAARWRGAATAPAAGAPSADALRSAERKEAAIARRDGPAYVVLTAAEAASLLEHRLAPAVRLALDSIRVTLENGRFVLDARLRTDRVAPAQLGPLAEFVGEAQPLRMAGPLRVTDPGRLSWTPDEAVIRGFPLPRAAIGRLVTHLTGGAEGEFIMPVPETVGDVRVRAEGVTFYRRADLSSGDEGARPLLAPALTLT